MRFGFSKYSRPAVLLLALMLSGLAFSAPYNGNIVELEQPDGTMIQVRFFGDEYYCRGESLDGYTVIRDPMSGWVVYADLNEDASDFIPTDVAYDHRFKTDPNMPEFTGGIAALRTEGKSRGRGLQKGLRLRRDVVADKHLKRRMELAEQRLYSPDSDSSDVAPAAAEIAPAPVTGSVVGLTLLVEFQDVRGTIPASEIDRFCNEIGYTGYSNNGSVRDYFLGVSGGMLDYTNIVTDYIRLDRNKSYYDTCGGWGKAGEVIDEALAKLCASGFDFSGLSMRGGRVMAFNVLYAGTPACGWSEGLWPHASSRNVTVCGKPFGSYQMTNIGSSLRLGTFCHENGHMVCQYPDLYDYYDDDTDGVSETNGVGNYCLMAYGGADTNPVPPCSFLRGQTGWETFIPVDTISGGTLLWHTANTNTSYKYTNPADSREYFLIESRLKTGRNASLPDEGLLVWRIRENGSNTHPTNHPTHPYRKGFRVAVEQADNQFHLERRSGYGGSGDLFHLGDKDQFSDFTLPDAKWWDDSYSGLMITDISAVGGEMSFRLGAGSEPTAHYAMNGNFSDSSANGYHATGYNFVNPWVGQSFTGSYDNLGSCLTFDGVDDYVNCPAAVGASAAWTCAMWVKAAKKADMGAADKFPTGSGGAGWSVRLMQSGQVALVIGSQSNSSTIITPVPVYEAGRWTHIACTYANGTAKIFVNGTLRMIRKGITQTPQTTALNAVIGRGAQLYTDYFFQGQMDDLRFYDVALDAGPLGMLAGLNFKPDKGILAYLPLEESAGTQAVDVSGRGSHGTLKNGLSFETGSTAGAVGKGLSFDGVDDHIALNPVMDRRNDGFTVALWANPQAVQWWARFIDFGNGSASDNILLARRESTNDLVFKVYNGTSAGAEVRAANAIELNKWQFFAATVDSTGSVRIYKNGQLIQSGTTAIPKRIYRSNLFIGRSNWAADAYYKGAMDDIRIYNYGLSEAEIAAIYQNNRMDGPVPFSGAGNVSPETVLTFTPALNAVRHDIYFGTEYGAVQSADTSSPEYQGRKTVASFNPPLLTAWREYFWRVDQVLADGTVQTGPVWRFSTVGSILRQVWTDLPAGNTLAGLTSSPNYPHNPSFEVLVDSFEAPTNWNDNYGTRMHGLLVPRISGSYTFWIASDDYSDLYLNKNGEDPAGAVRIAYVSGSTSPRDWVRFSSQRSAAIPLTAGKAYYIMALHKEGVGGDNLAVAWEGPDCPTRDVIDGFWLRPPRENESPVFDASVMPVLGAVEGRAFSAALPVSATDPEGQSVTYRRQTGSAWLQVAPNGQLSGTPQNADAGLNTFTIRALDGKGGFDDALLSIDVADRLTGTMGVSDLLGFADQWLNADMDSPANLDQAAPVNLDDFAILSDNWNADVIDGLFAHWPLDESAGLTARDSYGNHNGTLTNMSEFNWISGALDNALVFDGVNDYIRVADCKGIGGGASRTCSAWVRINGASSNMVILHWGANEAGRQWLMGIFSDGGFGIYAGGPLIKTTAAVDDGKWHHLAAVLYDDGSATLDKVKLYIDGALQPVTFTSAQVIDTAVQADLSIGAYSPSGSSMGSFYKGALDDIRIYDRALTDAEILESAAAGLQLSLSFDHTTGVTAVDNSVYGRNAIFNAAPAWQPAENIGGAVLLDGSRYAVAGGYKGISGGAGRTCSAWIKTGGSSSNMAILDWGGTASGQQWLMGIFSTGELAVYAGGPYIKTNAAVTDGRWHHVAVVLAEDETPGIHKIKLYIDGVLQNTTSNSTVAIDTAEGQDVSIGAYQIQPGQYGAFYTGMLDEIRIYDEPLSEAQIAELANP
jgi:M6 family metalloprotease-like protein